MLLRIFLIEDNDLIRENLVEMLIDLLPARVVGWAGTQIEAVQWLADNPEDWDLAVVDLFLAEGNGLGVLRHSANRQAHQKMVVLSNYATPDIRQRCAQEGADAVFDKSSELDEFMAWALTAVRDDLGTAA